MAVKSLKPVARDPELFLRNQKAYFDSIGIAQLTREEIQQIRKDMKETNTMVDKFRPKDYYPVD